MAIKYIGTIYQTDQTIELPVVSTRTIANVLDDAADLIENKGWVQGTMWNNNGFCIRGAIVITASTGSLEFKTLAYLSRYMYVNGYVKLPVLPGGLEAWNDNPSRSKFEVMECLRMAAKEWRNSHEKVA